MSLYLRAVSIFRTSGPAVTTGHGGVPYTNPDVPVNSVFALDVDGNFYAPRAPKPEDMDPTSWSQKPKGAKTVRLYRDYWVAVQASKGSPYMQSIVDAPRVYLVGP